jgi:hypothetical protein
MKLGGMGFLGITAAEKYGGKLRILNFTFQNIKRF